MGLAVAGPQKAAPTPAKSEAAPAQAAGPAGGNSDAQSALATAQTPSAQVLDQFKQGIPDPGLLLDLLVQLPASELAQIGKNQGYLDQIEARAGALLPQFHEVFALEKASESKEGEGEEKEDEHPKLKPDPSAIPGFLQKDVTEVVLNGWKEWRKLTNLVLQAHFADKLDEDVAAAKATGKNQLMNIDGPDLPTPPGADALLGSFGKWMFDAYDGPRNQDINYGVVAQPGPILTPVLIFFSGLIQYDFYSEALGAGVELTVSAPSNKTVKLAPGGIPLGLEAINVDAVRPRVQGMSKKPA